MSPVSGESPLDALNWCVLWASVLAVWTSATTLNSRIAISNGKSNWDACRMHCTAQIKPECMQDELHRTAMAMRIRGSSPKSCGSMRQARVE